MERPEPHRHQTCRDKKWKKKDIVLKKCDIKICVMDEAKQENNDEV